MSHIKVDTGLKVKEAHGIKARLEALADGMVANLRTVESIEDLTAVLDDFEANKATIIQDVLREK